MLSEEELQRLFKYAMALTHGESRAFDLVQTTVLKVLKKTPNQPYAYAKATLRNSFFDEQRNDKKYYQPEEDLGPNVVDTNTRAFEDVVIDRDQLQKLLNKIEPQDREILFLWAVEEHTFEEISHLLKVSKGTLLSRIHRLKKKIRKETHDESVS